MGNEPGKGRGSAAAAKRSTAVVPQSDGVGRSGGTGDLPAGWAELLEDEVTQPYWAELQRFVAEDRGQHEVYPREDDVFAAFELTPFDEVRVVILGQDPYINPGEAHGLCFSVPPGVTVPPSLRTVLDELRDDLGITRASGDLTGWARQGVLLLNTTLTVRRGESNSHEGRGWERFTDAVIRNISEHASHPVVFVLWGGPARSKKRLIDTDRHTVVEAAHPKAWATAHDPLRGSRPFSRIDAAVRGKPIDWSA